MSSHLEVVKSVSSTARLDTGLAQHRAQGTALTVQARAAVNQTNAFVFECTLKPKPWGTLPWTGMGKETNQVE